MADLDEGLVDYLLGQPDIAALIEKRLFPDYFPQDEQLPAIAYTLEDDSSQQTQQGPKETSRKRQHSQPVRSY